MAFKFNPLAPSFVPTGPSEALPVPQTRNSSSIARPRASVDSPRTPGTPRVSLTDFEIICGIGDGLVGRVYLVRYNQDGQTYAMKVVQKDQIVESDMVEHMQAERRIQSNVSEQSHPFVVPLFFAFQDDAHLFLIQEYVPGGDLRYHLTNRGKLPEEVARFLAAELVLAIEHLHQNRIIHRDIKANNVMIDKDGHVRLTDFGMSKQMGSENPDPNHQTTPDLAHTFCGTQPYMAPEILSGQGYSEAVDWWAFGVLLHEVLTGVQPFVPTAGDTMLNAITASARLPMLSTVSAPAAALLRGLLSQDLCVRVCSSTAIRESEFFEALDWESVWAGQIPPPWTPYCDLDDDEDVANFPFDVTDRTPPTTEDFVEFNRNADADAGVHVLSFSYVSPAMKLRQKSTNGTSARGEVLSFASSRADSSLDSLPFSMEKATPIFDEWGGNRQERDRGLSLVGESPPSVEQRVDAACFEAQDPSEAASGPNEWDPCFSMSL